MSWIIDEPTKHSHNDDATSGKNNFKMGLRLKFHKMVKVVDQNPGF